MHLELGCRAVHITFPPDFGAQRLEDNGFGIVVCLAIDAQFVEHLGALAHITLAVKVIFGAFLESDIFQVKHEIIEMG